MNSLAHNMKLNSVKVKQETPHTRRNYLQMHNKPKHQPYIWQEKTKWERERERERERDYQLFTITTIMWDKIKNDIKIQDKHSDKEDSQSTALEQSVAKHHWGLNCFKDAKSKMDWINWKGLQQ